ncbi:GntR family transcriptional regulator [Pseudoflavonifractor sp. 524-17]|uniref:GntR family transcriptional regulator n=1 Tax=Pseudoflavonifractor sp. 524-17 TaxID=2304577 RepID=UPI001379C95E|nr:GntR family transcriptional regulator [Pseudoflavonifractor sp. 524-17]
MSRTNYSAYVAIKNKILEIFRTETFEKNKLPSEAALANRLGISLVTLRESLMMLALEGYITKRHGSGNYVHPSTLDYENRSYYFTEYIKRKGCQPSIKLLSQAWQPAEEEDAKILNLEPGEEVLVNRLMYLADGNPAVYTVMRVPAAYLIRRDVEHMSFRYIHVLIRDYMNRDVAHALNEYEPMVVQGELAEILQMEEGAAIDCSHQVFYDVADDPVVCNTHYFNPEYYRLRTLQNWDLGR